MSLLLPRGHESPVTVPKPHAVSRPFCLHIAFHAGKGRTYAPEGLFFQEGKDKERKEEAGTKLVLQVCEARRSEGQQVTKQQGRDTVRRLRRRGTDTRERPHVGGLRTRDDPGFTRIVPPARGRGGCSSPPFSSLSTAGDSVPGAETRHRPAPNRLHGL